MLELREAYEALRKPPWFNHDMKMVRLYAAIDAVLLQAECEDGEAAQSEMHAQ